ncbi:MAG: hypothetical protein JO185_25965 [Acidobacteriaceae bacterium]|nr:hypothetical protein [Acidobacteriaceae bacterium]
MPIPISSASERRLAANRANAQLSTGPVTAEGKAKSSLNAVKTGLTGRTILLPSEDVAAYQEHIARYQQEFQPADERERTLVQNLADTQWRLNRIPGLETGLFALGRLRYADLFAEEQNPQVREALLDAHILMTDAKHFKNLYLQESRLRRQYREDTQELQDRQARRKEQEEKEAQTQLQTQRAEAKARAATNGGFEFINTEEPSTGQTNCSSRDSASLRARHLIGNEGPKKD